MVSDTQKEYFRKSLESLDWASVSHAYGSASDIPEKLLRLLDISGKNRKDAFDELWDALIHQGSTFSAGAYCVDFLVGLLDQDLIPEICETLDLLLNIALGSDIDLLFSNSVAQSYKSASDKLSTNVSEYWRNAGQQKLKNYQLVERRLSSIIRLLDSADPNVVEHVAYFLSWFPFGHLDSIRKIAAKMRALSSRELFAKVLLSLGWLEHQNEVQVPEMHENALAMLQGESDLARYAAAVYLWLQRKNVSKTNESVIQTLRELAGNDDFESIEGMRFADGDLSQFANVLLNTMPKGSAG